MSAPAVRERVQRLEETGLLLWSRTELDLKLLGYPVAVVVRIKPMPGQLPAIIDLARKTPRVVECLRITGDDCFLLRAYIESIDVLDSLLDPFLAFGQTTSIVQSAPVPLRTLPLQWVLPSIVIASAELMNDVELQHVEMFGDAVGAAIVTNVKAADLKGNSVSIRLAKNMDSTSVKRLTDTSDHGAGAVAGTAKEPINLSYPALYDRLE
jgi:Lrp/AsnC family leucine-responsive transcriptional regulator